MQYLTLATVHALWNPIQMANENWCRDTLQIATTLI